MCAEKHVDEVCFYCQRRGAVHGGLSSYCPPARTLPTPPPRVRRHTARGWRPPRCASCSSGRVVSLAGAGVGHLRGARAGAARRGERARGGIPCAEWRGPKAWRGGSPHARQSGGAPIGGRGLVHGSQASRCAVQPSKARHQSQRGPVAILAISAERLALSLSGSAPRGQTPSWAEFVRPGGGADFTGLGRLVLSESEWEQVWVALSRLGLGRMPPRAGLGMALERPVSPPCSTDGGGSLSQRRCAQSCC